MKIIEHELCMTKEVIRDLESQGSYTAISRIQQIVNTDKAEGGIRPRMQKPRSFLATLGHSLDSSQHKR